MTYNVFPMSRKLIKKPDVEQQKVWLNNGLGPLKISFWSII